MKPSYLRPLLIAGLSLCLFALSPVTLRAQATKIFVASYGNDANDGSRGSPKRNFQAAHDAVAASGEVVVLDTSGYGALNITKSLSITVPPGVNGFVTVTGDNNAINVAASFGDLVTLRGLVLQGGGSGNFGNGVNCTQVGSLTVEDCVIRNFNVGISLVTSKSAALVVGGCSIRDVYDGIVLLPNAANVTETAVITGCTVNHATQAAIGATINATPEVARLTVANCVIINSATGIYPYGTGATAYLDNCVVSGNTTGVFSSQGAITYSRGNNTFTGNNSDGTVSSFTAK